MKASNTLTNWMKAKYGKVPQDLDQHYADLTKELSAYGPITDVDHAAMINHVSNMEAQGRTVPMAAPVVKPVANPGMHALLAKMQAHGSTLPAKMNSMRKLPHLQDGGVIPAGGSAVVGDNQANPSASTPEVASNPAGNAPVTVQPAPQAASIPAGQDPNTNGSAAQLQAATDVASKLTGLSPQAVAQMFDPQKIISLYQHYISQINGSPISRALENATAALGGPAMVNAQNATNAANDARVKDSIMGPTLAGMDTFAKQQEIDRANAPILSTGAGNVIGLPTTNSINATTQSGNALTQLQNQGNINITKQAQDPDSPYSQGLLSVVKPLLAKMNVTVPDNMSAAMFTAAYGGVPQIAALVKQFNDQQIAQQTANNGTVEAGAKASQAATDAQRVNADVTGKTAQAAKDADTVAGLRTLDPQAVATIQSIDQAIALVNKAYTGPGGSILAKLPSSQQQQLRAALAQVSLDKVRAFAQAAGARAGGNVMIESKDIDSIGSADQGHNTLIGNLNRIRSQILQTQANNHAMIQFYDNPNGSHTLTNFKPPVSVDNMGANPNIKTYNSNTGKIE